MKSETEMFQEYVQSELMSEIEIKTKEFLDKLKAQTKGPQIIPQA